MIVLAGGRSLRLGRDKALLPWGESTVIEHVVARCQSLSDDLLVITGEKIRYSDLLRVPIVADEIVDCGPMGGLYTGLKRARYEYSLAVACDMPLVRPELVQLLAQERVHRSWAIVPEVNGHRVPTLALYHKSCLSIIEQLLSRERTSLQALLDAVSVRVIPEERVRESDPDLRSFVNLNRLEDWERWRVGSTRA
ncbi:MAG: molybdenum cofactor guanylyltransferase [Candidatus Bipolaricaulota bacterium]|nr:molybdenum cofactor guanylyltransferase [Candidatus Bipolaricaulota bacterium]MCS7274720.1 molybdenum cofactor guanylyltransferase [Candidatus Bipolaricaulota bacterium]MDW8109997.1 molybdenum cofactor guanylyltransferase [Candidatus Bipolaricaulota bacterium]MDW8328931.1 molybdenum cofactor guanylyltransferase [Candidatus Bipolaricaulota bacterium]